MARARTTSDVFNAIAEPRRRAIVMYLRDGESAVGEMAAALELPQPSVSKHLNVLREVSLVTARRAGRRTLYRANPAALKTVHDWVAQFERHWTRQLDDVKRIAEAEAARMGHTESTPPKQPGGPR